MVPKFDVYNIYIYIYIYVYNIYICVYTYPDLPNTIVSLVAAGTTSVFAGILDYQ